MLPRWLASLAMSSLADGSAATASACGKERPPMRHLHAIAGAHQWARHGVKREQRRDISTAPIGG